MATHLLASQMILAVPDPQRVRCRARSRACAALAQRSPPTGEAGQADVIG
jgi:hypothetical protein